MKPTLSNLLLIGCFALFVGCKSTSEKSANRIKNQFDRGSYGYDLEFLKRFNQPVVELKDKENGACVMLAPGLQGRVMTSSANGLQGKMSRRSEAFPPKRSKLWKSTISPATSVNWKT